MSREYVQIHAKVVSDPEQVWDRVRDFLATRTEDSEGWLERTDLIEDLMWWHADQFIDRLEQLVDESPWVAQLVAQAHVGGTAETPGLTRFYELQDRLTP